VGALLALVLLAPLPASAAGTLRSTLTEQSNVVAGATAAAIYRDMLRHPIIDPDSGKALANLTHEHKLDITTAVSGDQCRVTRLDFTWHFVMTLPRARDEAALPSKTRQLWRSFVARLRSHELHHRDLFLDCGHTFVPAAAALTAPQCSQLDRSIRRYIDTQYDACMDQQFAYDRADTRKIQNHAFIQLAKQN
jgi:predicted secreted Zn-dependent protease